LAWLDQRRVVGHAQRRGLELLQVVDGAVTMPFLGPSLAGRSNSTTGTLR
jgi:hypothetical protein